MVLFLLQQRKYELQAMEVTRGSKVRNGDALPRRWTDRLLEPGSKISMNVLISGIKRDISSPITCPACLSSFPADEVEDQSSGFEWHVSLTDVVILLSNFVAAPNVGLQSGSQDLRSLRKRLKLIQRTRAPSRTIAAVAALPNIISTTRQSSGTVKQSPICFSGQFVCAVDSESSKPPHPKLNKVCACCESCYFSSRCSMR